MKKIIVVGPSGAGKSFLSKQLGKILNIKVFHLDNIFWNSDKTYKTHEEFDNEVSNILKLDSWIIDGDYSRTYEDRIKKCDTIIFLNYDLETCLNGASSRIGTKRDDLPWIETDFDPEFKQWIIDWFDNKLPIINNLILKHKCDKNIIILKNRNEGLNFINKLEADYSKL